MTDLFLTSALIVSLALAAAVEWRRRQRLLEGARKEGSALVAVLDRRSATLESLTACLPRSLPTSHSALALMERALRACGEAAGRLAADPLDRGAAEGLSRNRERFEELLTGLREEAEVEEDSPVARLLHGLVSLGERAQHGEETLRAGIAAKSARRRWGF